MSYYRPFSFWEQDAWFGKADITIVGGGIVGMQAALRLRAMDAKAKIVIIERASIGTAASSRNAGFACYGSPSELLSDLAEMPESSVQELVSKRIRGLDLLRSTVGDTQLRYRRTGGHEIFVRQDDYDYHMDHLARINRLLSEINPELVYRLTTNLNGITKVAGMLSNQWEGHIHPGHMTSELRRLCNTKEIRILTNLEVLKIEQSETWDIITSEAPIRSHKVIVCNNAFAKDLLHLETTSVRNQVLVTTPIQGLRLSGCYHLDRGYVYFRDIGDRILIGGGRNMDISTETTDEFGATEIIQEYLERILTRHVLSDSNYNIEYRWSGILGFNKTKQPIVQEIEKNLFVAVGLGGMGVAIGSLVGHEVADLLLQS